MIDQNRVQELLEEATVDCYNEEEEFLGVLYTLAENLNFPLRATALGEPVEVIGLDDNRSSLRRGILVRVRKGEQAYQVALSGLEFVDPDPTSAEWLAMYRYWSGWASWKNGTSTKPMGVTSTPCAGLRSMLNRSGMTLGLSRITLPGIT